mmetsp:Transcript_58056/g.149466  ORF Transcript_58056/g.149466 Transcript_58056/m.149466 type:complete len:298 (+) Transcript_58056:332-1225(+)
MRLRPQPPAFDESRNANAFVLSGRLKSSTSFMRLLMAIVPSSRWTPHLFCSHIFSMISSVIVQFEMITTRSPLPAACTAASIRWSSSSLPDSSSRTGRCWDRSPRSCASTSSKSARVSSSSKPASSLCVAERTRKGWFTRDCSFLMVPSTVRVIFVFWSRTLCATFDLRNDEYTRRWKSDISTKTLKSCLAGRKRAFSLFVRLRMNRSVTSETSASFSCAWRRSSAVAVGSRPRRMGAPYLRLKAASSPKTPGLATLTRVKNSSRLFWIGVPEIRRRRFAESAAMHLVVLASSFFSL